MHLDAIALGICRLGLASLGMTLLLALRWSRTESYLQQWNWRTTRALLLVGFAFGFHWLLFFLSIKIGSAAIGTIGFSTYLYLPLSLIIGYLSIGEKLSGRALLGTALVLIANALVIASQLRRGARKI